MEVMMKVRMKIYIITNKHPVVCLEVIDEASWPAEIINFIILNNQEEEWKS